VCFVCVLNADTSRWVLSLSMVGSHAAVFREIADVRVSLVEHRMTICSNKVCLKVSGGIRSVFSRGRDVPTDQLRLGARSLAYPRRTVDHRSLRPRAPSGSGAGPFQRALLHELLSLR
jgi:hypothetical protein